MSPSILARDYIVLRYLLPVQVESDLILTQYWIHLSVFLPSGGLGRGIRMRRGGAHSLSLVRDTIASKNSESRDNQPLSC